MSKHNPLSLDSLKLPYKEGGVPSDGFISLSDKKSTDSEDDVASSAGNPIFGLLDFSGSLWNPSRPREPGPRQEMKAFLYLLFLVGPSNSRPNE